MKYQIGATSLSWFITHKETKTTCFFEWSESYDDLMTSLTRLKEIPSCSDLFEALDRHKTDTLIKEGFWWERDAFDLWSRILKDLDSRQPDVFAVRCDKVGENMLHIYNQHIAYGIDIENGTLSYGVFQAHFDDYDPMMYASFQEIIQKIHEELQRNPGIVGLLAERTDYPSLQEALAWITGYDCHYAEGDLHL